MRTELRKSPIRSTLRTWQRGLVFPCAPGRNPAASIPVSRRTYWTGLVLLLIAGLVLLSNLNYPLLEPDETRFGQIGLEMYESGNLLTPTLYGQPYLDKPPLLFWLLTASYSTLGVHEWAARLPSTVAAIGSVCAVFLLGRRLLGERVATTGSLLLLCCAAFPLTGRFLNMDGLLTSFTTCAFLAICLGWQDPRSATRWFALAGIACALGVLTKGPIAMALCLPPVIVVAWVNRDRRALNGRMWWMLLGPAVVLALPWFALVASHQEQFTGHFFWKHHLVRFFDAFHHQQPWWFYAPVLALGMFPCSLLFPALAARVFRRSAARRDPAFGFIVLSAAWIVLLFSLSSCKLPTYVLPALPLICLACGKIFDEQILCQHTSNRAFPNSFVRLRLTRVFASDPWRIGVLWLVFGLGTAIAQLLFHSPSLSGTVLLAVFGLGCTALACAAARLPRVHQRWMALAGLVLLVDAYGFDRLLPDVARWRSLSRPAAELRESLGGESVPVVYYNRSRVGSAFYVRGGRIVEFVAAPADEIKDFFQEHPLAVLVTTSASVEELRRYCPQLSVTAAGGRGHLYVSRPADRLAARHPRPTNDR